MKYNSIYIWESDLELVTKAIIDFIDMHSIDEPVVNAGDTFFIYAISESEFLIQAPDSFDNIYFSYLVNYVVYSKQGTRLKAKGLTKGDGNLHPDIQGKNLLFFIPDTDREYDNVYIVTDDNLVYKNDFGGSTSVINADITFELPEIDDSSLKEPFSIAIPEENKIKNEGIIGAIKKLFRY